MSAITGIGGYNANLWQSLSQAEGDLSDSSLLVPLTATGLQATSTDAQAATTATGVGDSTDLQEQIQEAVSAALQSVEQLGSTDVKGVIYNTLVEVLKKNGIDPKTFKSTTDQRSAPNSGNGSQPALDSATRNTLGLVLAALSSATASSDPLTQLLPSEDANTQQSGNRDLVGFLFDSEQ